MKVTTHQL